MHRHKDKRDKDTETERQGDIKKKNTQKKRQRHRETKRKEKADTRGKAITTPAAAAARPPMLATPTTSLAHDGGGGEFSTSLFLSSLFIYSVHPLFLVSVWVMVAKFFLFFLSFLFFIFLSIYIISLPVPLSPYQNILYLSIYLSTHLSASTTVKTQFTRARLQTGKLLTSGRASGHRSPPMAPAWLRTRESKAWKGIMSIHLSVRSIVPCHIITQKSQWTGIDDGTGG